VPAPSMAGHTAANPGFSVLPAAVPA
jgi:hypothetical protein